MRKLFILLICLAFFSINKAFCQNTKSFDHKLDYKKSFKQKQIEDELNRLKNEDRVENLYRIIELNKNLADLTGSSVAAHGRIEQSYKINLVNPDNQLQSGGFNDDIPNNRIYTDNNRKIKGIAAAIEQRGSTAGKIWSVVFYSANSTSPDTFKVYYSINNGISWNYFIGGNIRPGDFVTPDDIDMELVENNTGQKYLWVMFGFKQVSGRKAIGSFVLQVPNPNGAFFNILKWSQSDSLKNYYNVRLTSDNARYAATPYVFLACSFDSVDGSGNRVNSQKFLRILSPYSISNPSISFMTSKFYWYENSSSFQRTSFTDIAYFNNGGSDSVLVSFCGVPDSTRIYFAKSDINGNPPVSSNGAGGNIGGSESNDQKTYARLSSNGNDNGSIICTFRQFTNGNWNVKYFSSTNYGNFEAPFTESMLLGCSVNSNFMPEITGTRNGSTHYLTFLTNSSADSIHFFSINSGGIFNSISRMNYFTASDVIAPKPLFRYQNSDSCLVFYSEDGPINMLSAIGCSGEPIGIINQQIPFKFALEQNYPNPFNPSTVISFTIPHKALTALKVYDTLGKLIGILVDRFLPAGSYSYRFNGSGLASGVYFYKLNSGEYSEIRKMVLLK